MDWIQVTILALIQGLTEFFTYIKLRSPYITVADIWLARSGLSF